MGMTQLAREVVFAMVYEEPAKEETLPLVQ